MTRFWISMMVMLPIGAGAVGCGSDGPKSPLAPPPVGQGLQIKMKELGIRTARGHLF